MLRVVSALRRIAQAMDSHSKWLDAHVRLTIPQLLVLEALRASREPLSAGTVAERVSLTQGTVTSILDRLEGKGLITRTRGDRDRRRVMVELTLAGRATLKGAPALMHDAFVRDFAALPEREREALTAALERVADMVRPPDASLQAPEASSQRREIN